MIQKLFFFFLLIGISIHIFSQSITNTENEKTKIAGVLDKWHQDAANANYTGYFKAMTNDAIFIGTDPTENWNRQAFETFCKPYFDKKKTWHFTKVQRNIYINELNTIAWFDELLDTQMKLCRGSGVLKKIKGEWKIAHYALSITIPNENTKSVTQLKTNFDDSLKSVLVK
jgi:hypothetical protein